MNRSYCKSCDMEIGTPEENADVECGKCYENRRLLTALRDIDEYFKVNKDQEGGVFKILQGVLPEYRR